MACSFCSVFGISHRITFFFQTACLCFTEKIQSTTACSFIDILNSFFVKMSYQFAAENLCHGCNHGFLLAFCNG